MSPSLDDPSAEPERTLAKMAARLHPGRAAGGDACVQLRLEGEGGGDWGLIIHEGRCQVERGMHPEARATLQADLGDLVTLMTAKGEERFWPFLQGTMAVEGEMQLLWELFDLSEEG
jgi:hypothetical protein